MYCIALFLTATYHLPNRVYYLALTPEQLKATVRRVLEYATLELLSLVVLGFVLDRLLGFSTLRLLAFTFHKHALLAQALLIFWVMFATQLTLEHLGTSLSCCCWWWCFLPLAYRGRFKATTLRSASSGYGIQNLRLETHHQLNRDCLSPQTGHYSVW
jgi:hypothetical protein